jgi:hypothetical protein
LAFAIQRVLPTSPIYRGPNPTHIEVQICAHKGSKALHTSQRLCAFALRSEVRGSNWTFWLSAQVPSSNWMVWLSAQDFSGSDARSSSNWTFQFLRTRVPKQLDIQLSAQVPPSSHPRVYAKQDDGMHLHFHSIQKGRISTSSQVDWI